MLKALQSWSSTPLCYFHVIFIGEKKKEGRLPLRAVHSEAHRGLWSPAAATFSGFGANSHD